VSAQSQKREFYRPTIDPDRDLRRVGASHINWVIKLGMDVLTMSCLSNYAFRATAALAITAGLLSATPAFSGAHNTPGRVIELIEVTDEQLRVLRTDNPAFSQMDNEELIRLLSILKNEEGMVSGEGVSDEIGVLVLAHGFHGDGYDEFRAAFKSIADVHPTGYGFGLAILESDHLQKVIDQITSQGAKKIILFPATSALNSGMVRQWEYALNFREDFSYTAVDKIATNAELIWAPGPIPHPLSGEILRDHAKALSKDPSNELVIITGHGPQRKVDNDRELETLQKHADFMKADVGFYDVRPRNVQDDAPPQVRADNVEVIRGWVNEANADGKDVIVVTTILTAAGVMEKLENDTKDLGVRFSSAGLMTNERFSDWLNFAIENTLAQTDN
jgi:hypothetical protein